MLRAAFIGLLLVFFTSCRDKQKIEKAYYDDGNLMSEAPIKNGKWDGKTFMYYPSGKIENVSYWKEGRLDGESKIYYENGVLKQVNYYINGLKTGESRHYSEDGHLLEIHTFDEKGRLYDYKSFLNDGRQNLDLLSRLPILISNKDTVDFGKYFECKVRLGNREFDWIDVIVCDPDDPDFLDKPRLPKLDSTTAILQLKGETEGENKVEGYIIEINKKYPDSIAQFYFHKTFYVRKQKPPVTASILTSCTPF